ncbi:unnamed protein product [Parascedosporium putredinis]|uniref:Glutamine synthetase n=1 Tax=Parascedosporium putredinis TaxID=1442378 RepID=A0A9P1H4S6_9PEZI|nr:unnamed protein product [Parascedosporium putredinis]CAI7995925.1 unnamed protein product [Parascedosporium putredinis]
MTATSNENALAGRARLAHVIKTIPVVDNHAHPLLLPTALGSYSFEGVVSEANGDALSFVPSSLAHIRAVKQLSNLHKCQPTWEAVVTATEGKRAPERYDDWMATCLAGTETILVDDGIGNPFELYPYEALSAYTRSRCWRIVRIERVVEDIVNSLLRLTGKTPVSFHKVVVHFDAEISSAQRDPWVAGFKSAICYRTGLIVPTSVDADTAERAFEHELARRRETGDSSQFRLQQPSLTDYFLLRAAAKLQDAPQALVGSCKFTPASAITTLILQRHLPHTFKTSSARIRQCRLFSSTPAVRAHPWAKILFSTDGNMFPEVYYLGQLQFRQALESVLAEYVAKDDLTWKEAENAAAGIMYQNANKLYSLGLPKPQLDLPRLCIHDSGPRPATTGGNALQIVETLLEYDLEIRYLRLYWNDMTGTPRVRAIDINHALAQLRSGALSLGITTASLGLMQNDTLAPGATGTGEFKFYPDWSWVRRGPRPGHISVYGEFRHTDGSPSPLCPRTALKNAVELASSHGYGFLLGFELELVLVQQHKSGSLGENDQSNGHCWSSSRAMDRPIYADVIEKAISYLRSVDVRVEQVHAESAPGQFEVVLPAVPALQAVDNLLFVREVIASTAASAGYRMTLHPKPFAMAAGTAAHVHMSITGPKESDEPAVYERVVDGCWAGGRWVAWGTQNRETPLRKIAGSHWEMKCMDGTANPYLALAAVLHAGIRGILDGEQLSLQDCAADPATLSATERAGFGITKMLPGTLAEALEALKEDKALGKLMGHELVERYVSVKGVEIRDYEAKNVEERRQWIMEHY